MVKSSGLVMEKVTILRRGKSLDSTVNSEASKKGCDDLVVCETQRLGQNLELVPNQIRIIDVKSDSYCWIGVRGFSVAERASFAIFSSVEAGLSGG